MRNRHRLRAREGVLIATLLALSSPARADIAPDTGLAARQAQSLAHVAPMLVPLRAYNAGDRSDCVIMDSDGAGLVARLELDRRGLSGGNTPAEVAPWAKHLADSIYNLVGAAGAPGRCSWNVAGAPAPMNATAHLAYALHRYGTSWPAEVKESIRAAVEDAAWEISFYLGNGNIASIAAELLAGEALGRSTLFDRGANHLQAVVDETKTHGGCEVNAPMYTGHHFPPLIFLQALRATTARDQARILLEYELLLQAHLYLPGGSLGAPQMRDYSGGAADGDSQAMLPVLWLLIGDPDLTIDMSSAYNFVVSAATEYVVPELIRSLFIDKGSGYTFWAYTLAQQGSGRTPNAVYSVGLDGSQAIPWQAVVLAGGAASIGVAYGFRLTALYVSLGVYTRAAPGNFAVLYQYQPAVTGDTDDTLSVMSGSGLDGDPDDFTSELYDYERLVYGQTLISLWDPTTQHKPAGVVRTHQDTRVYLPSYAALGGAAVTSGGWRVGQLGQVYIAYRPLGTLGLEELRGSGSYTFMRLDGPSGGITELATTSDFATIDAYAADLATRHLSFTTDPIAAEFDARDPQSGSKVRVRLEYAPERRVIGGVEQSIAAALDHGLLESPWVSWDGPNRQLQASRDCYPPITYDWELGTVTTGSPPGGCQGRDGGSIDSAQRDGAPADGGNPPGSTLTAVRAAQPPLVDGLLDEAAWSSAGAAAFSGIASQSDNSVSVRALWDSNSLYLGYHVVDADLEAQAAGTPWSDDGAEFYLDTALDRATSMQGDDYHLIVPIAGATLQARGNGTGEDDVSSTVHVTAARHDHGTGYDLEIRLAWTELGIRPQPNQRLGLLLANNDRDLGLVVQFDWIGVIPFAQPNLWGTLILAPASAVDAGPADRMTRPDGQASDRSGSDGGALDRASVPDADGRDLRRSDATADARTNADAGAGDRAASARDRVVVSGTDGASEAPRIEGNSGCGCGSSDAGGSSSALWLAALALCWVARKRGRGHPARPANGAQ